MARTSSKAKLSRGMGDHPKVRKKSKLVVTFDPDKRKEYLTGFHKRKQERRRFGLDMEAYKTKKRQLEIKRQRREEQKEMMAALNLLDDYKKRDEEENDDLDDGDDACSAKAVTKIETFNDSFTQGKFGDIVTVTTSVGNLQSESDDSCEEETDESIHSAFQQKKSGGDKEQYLTLFQRIQQQRKGKALPSKRSKLKDARAFQKGGAVSNKKRGVEDGKNGGSAASKLSKQLKMKRQQRGGNKRYRKR
ncbi:Uncharacterized conserved protein [Plasmopara halstedii]|uniref:Uncharacterized conserved protein n=1 Tax=Plasmopara halstedii TaxID=4781 RepID=A0A0P1AFX9_PLAHL|nr:Uncharacterized conserved protein [Plasmopara halstedii]CEG40001.1 Uncharacterized conserved protein [Plasmopara halstedii]|eukprot:XP_024576370.1 Uncharacterized conserved protein [Plasmopara halstedii]